MIDCHPHDDERQDDERYDDEHHDDEHHHDDDDDQTGWSNPPAVVQINTRRRLPPQDCRQPQRHSQQTTKIRNEKSKKRKEIKA